LSITQEQLCDEICSAETLSRIENGSQNPSRDVYELLMERMGRIRDRAYSLLSVSDLKVLEKMKLFEDNIKQYDFTQAEAILNEIKQRIGSSILDNQFLLRAESITNYFQKRITAQEYLEASETAIRLTIPKYGLISLSNWPLSFNEAQLLINISNAYEEKHEYQNAINVIKDAYSAMKKSYMEEQQRAILQVTIANNLSKFYGLNGNHEEAIVVANEGVQICKKSKLGNALPNLLYGIAWNKERLIDKGVLSPDHEKECLCYFEQAYYFAMATRLSYMEEFVHKHVLVRYGSVLNVIDFKRR
jgi:transcriptional regulator with XRE-family HTH domain